MMLVCHGHLHNTVRIPAFKFTTTLELLPDAQELTKSDRMQKNRW